VKKLLLLACGAISVWALDPVPPPSVEEAGLRQLLGIRRVYVDRLTGGETAAQMREILISSLEGTKLFILTENQERADAVMHGGAEDLVFTEVHNSSDSLNGRSNFGMGTTRYQRGASGGVGIGDSDTEHSSERRHEAVAAVRLVNKDGDVIWSTTQESLGAKFRGSSADVAEKITGKLKEDFDRARKLR
jgi:hypothetical protein